MLATVNSRVLMPESITSAAASVASVRRPLPIIVTTRTHQTLAVAANGVKREERRPWSEAQGEGTFDCNRL